MHPAAADHQVVGQQLDDLTVGKQAGEYAEGRVVARIAE
jgi:hypothetical protein